MTGAERLLADLRRRAIDLTRGADGLRYAAPRGALTSADRAAVAAHRAELVGLLQAEAEESLPSSPCGCCRRPLVWVDDWPTEGQGRWLCPTCAAWPAPALAEVFARLTAAERDRFAAEVAEGDPLALAVRDSLPRAADWGRNEPRRRGHRLGPQSVVREAREAAERPRRAGQ